jgi:adenine phosphoribosyltransferase
VTNRCLAQIGTQSVDLPIVELAPGVRAALLMTIDLRVSVLQKASEELAELLVPRNVDVVVTAATLGIPVAAPLSARLGLDRYLVLQKSRKWHLRDSPYIELTSSTTMSSQRFTLDASRAGEIAGARVAFVDDVIASGGSARAALDLLVAHGANIVSVAALMTEGDEWRERLGPYAELVQSLGTLPSGDELPPAA